jgi:tetratricopeptide (TPR) repeat protein
VHYAELSNNIFYTAISWYYSGYGCYLLGDLGAALQYAEKGYAMHKDAEIVHMIYLYPLLLGCIHLDLGNVSVAEKYAEEALALSNKRNSENFIGESRILLGRIWGKSKSAKIDEAEINMRGGIEILQALQLRPYISRGYFYLGELHGDTGEYDKALECLKKSESEFQDIGMEYDLSFCKSLI